MDETKGNFTDAVGINFVLSSGRKLVAEGQVFIQEETHSNFYQL